MALVPGLRPCRGWGCQSWWRGPAARCPRAVGQERPDLGFLLLLALKLPRTRHSAPQGADRAS